MRWVCCNYACFSSKCQENFELLLPEFHPLVLAGHRKQNVFFVVAFFISLSRCLSAKSWGAETGIFSAKISLLSSSHHIRILIYSIWLWILKSSVPFKILFKFKASPSPPPSRPLHWWRRSRRGAMRRVLTLHHLISLPTPPQPLPSLKVYWDFLMHPMCQK